MAEIITNFMKLFLVDSAQLESISKDDMTRKIKTIIKLRDIEQRR